MACPKTIALTSSVDRDDGGPQGMSTASLNGRLGHLPEADDERLPTRGGHRRLWESVGRLDRCIGESWPGHSEEVNPLGGGVELACSSDSVGPDDRRCSTR